ncbi:MAG TPA: UPF0175 family protein [Longimicrobium sp.]|nr:UPF0175 family protein [Longimicrobium sp.]
MKPFTSLLVFQSGEISAGAASELAGIGRLAFAAECTRHNIPLIDYDSSRRRRSSGCASGNAGHHSRISPTREESGVTFHPR